MSPQPPSTIGMVGLGVMGGAITTHLLRAGYTVTGFDPNQARTEELAAGGGIVAASPSEVADRAEVVLTALPSRGALDDAITGYGGLAGTRNADVVVVEASTLSLAAKERARRTLAERDILLLDCPLSGTGAQALTGDLVVYASGDPDGLARVAPVLDTFTRSRHDVGEFGTGTKLKLIANLLVSVHTAATAEALLLAGRSGLDLGLVLRAIGDGAGSSRMFEVRGPLMATGDYEGPGARVGLFIKDIDIITAFAREHASPTPLLAATAQQFTAALAQGRGDQDAACLYGVLQQLTAPEQPPES